MKAAPAEPEERATAESKELDQHQLDVEEHPGALWMSFVFFPNVFPVKSVQFISPPSN